VDKIKFTRNRKWPRWLGSYPGICFSEKKWNQGGLTVLSGAIWWTLNRAF